MHVSGPFRQVSVADQDGAVHVISIDSLKRMALFDPFRACATDGWCGPVPPKESPMQNPTCVIASPGGEYALTGSDDWQMRWLKLVQATSDEASGGLGGRGGVRDDGGSIIDQDDAADDGGYAVPYE